MKRFRRILAGVLAFVVLAGLAAAFLLPRLAKPILEEKLSAALSRPVSLGKLSLNPLTLAIGLKDLRIGDREGSAAFVTLEELRVDAAGFSSLIHRAVILDEIVLTAPQVRMVRFADGTYNFSDLLVSKEAAPKKDDSPPPLFSLNNIQIRGGSIDFDDRPKGTRHTVRDLILDVPFVSNLDYEAKHYVEPRFSARINDDPYVLQGRSLPFSESRETRLDVRIDDLDLPHYLAYLPVKTAFRVPSAKLDARLALRFLLPAKAKPTVEISGQVGLRELAVDDLQRRKIFHLAKLDVGIAALDPFGPAVHLSALTLTKPDLVLRRDREGHLQLAGLVPQEGERRTKRAAPAPPPQGTAKPEPEPLQLRIDRLALEDGAVTILDDAPPESAKISLEPLRLQMNGLSLAKDSKASLDLALTVDRKGTVGVKGTVGLHPLDLQLDVALRQIPIRTAQPYLADKVRLQVVRGGLSAQGRLAVAEEKQGAPRVTYRGQVSVADFASRDKTFGNEFVTWKIFVLSGMEVQSQPLRLHIRNVLLRDYFARVVMNPDGTLNLQRLAPEEAAASPPSARAQAPRPPSPTAAPPARPDIRIDRVDLDRGAIDYTDRFIKPNYAARMREMTGSITGLSSQETARAAVDLRGRLDRGSAVRIAGQINPLAQRRFVDMALQFKDVELSPVTPYASKYLGHPILKGKLTFDVAYWVDGAKLDAKHKVFIDQLTLGDRVESPDAIKAPVSLGVSLLKDRNGQINLDIPVTGSLDDPEFEVWPIVWQVIGNIFMKALTAPFSLLASLGGGGEELSYIEFDAGSGDLTEAGRQKVSALAKALFDRPNLRLDIEGHADPAADREALKKRWLDVKVKARKLDDMIEAGNPAIPVGKVVVSSGEYDKYLAQVYGDTDMVKPRNLLGLAKRLPRAEMERLLLENAAVTDGDLQRLALRRGEAVKEEILKGGQVAPGRLFLVTAVTLSPEKKDKVKDSRVDFRLK